MKIKVLCSLTGIRGEVENIKCLYAADPAGCYFLNEHKGVKREAGSCGGIRVPVVELSDWTYDDLHEVIKLTMNLPEQEIDDIIKCLQEVEAVGEWRPLLIEVAFVVFELPSENINIRKQVGKIVERFQTKRGFDSNSGEWGGFWIGRE